LFLTQPASGGHGALKIEAIRLTDIENGTKAEFEYEQRMLKQIAAQARTAGQIFL